MTMQAYMVEQRREDRKQAKGEIWFTLEDTGSIEFRGLLIDSSNSGFRASHSNKALCTGQRVGFHHALGQGFAVVMWNRILDPDVESGFLILDK
jgi:hypothetical protein